MNGAAQAALFANEFRTAIASRFETNPRQLAPVGGRVLPNFGVESEWEMQPGPKGVDAELLPSIIKLA